MSAGIVSGKTLIQDHKDDLESSLYTLLWVMVMYSKCPNPDQASSLLSTIFEPPATGIRVNFAKLDFLRGRSFLTEIDWPERRILIELLIQLAELFATRYVKVTTDEGLSHLVDHEAIINLFDAALKDRSQWPDADVAEKQQYHRLKKVTDGLELKTGWNTSLLDPLGNNDVEMKEHPHARNEDHQMVDIEPLMVAAVIPGSG